MVKLPGLTFWIKSVSWESNQICRRAPKDNDPSVGDLGVQVVIRSILKTAVLPHNRLDSFKIVDLFKP